MRRRLPQLPYPKSIEGNGQVCGVFDSYMHDGATDLAVCGLSDIYNFYPHLTPIEQLMAVALWDVARHAGITLQAQVPVGPYRVDFILFNSNMRVVVECDGHDYHERTKDQAKRDRARVATSWSQRGCPDRLGDLRGGEPTTVAPASRSFAIPRSKAGVIVSNDGRTSSW